MYIDDDILKNCADPISLKVWQPTSAFVVLGNSNQAEMECHVEDCTRDNIAILKRYGGGGTVVLYPECVIISLGMWVKDYYENDFYFRHLNQAILTLLSKHWPIFVSAKQDGISDLVFEDKKFAGTSLFRSRNYLLYQASVMTTLKLDLIEKYLRLPSRQPAYRKNRSHEEFLTATTQIHPGASVEHLTKVFREEFVAELSHGALGERFLAPQSEQFSHLLKRASHSPVVGREKIQR